MHKRNEKQIGPFSHSSLFCSNISVNISLQRFYVDLKSITEEFDYENNEIGFISKAEKFNKNHKKQNIVLQ